MLTEKQQFELNAVRLLQSATGMLADCQLTPGRNPPDVFAHNENRTVGVEVRRLFTDERRRGSAQRQQLGLAQSTTALAQRLHGSTASEYCEVSVIYSNSIPLLDGRVSVIAQMMVALVTQEPLVVGDRREFTAEANWGPAWPEEVDTLDVRVLGQTGGPMWHNAGAVWVGETTRGILQAALDAKDSRYQPQSQELWQQWVLLVCDGSVQSSALRIHGNLGRESYCSSFDRAFVLDFTGRNCAELNIAGNHGVA